MSSCLIELFSSMRRMMMPSERSSKFQFKVSIEGNIGSGKSTFIDYLSKRSGREELLFDLYEEPVREWQNLNGVNLLEATYKDPTRNGFAFQSYAMLTMLKLYLTKPSSPCEFKVFERSFLSARYCFLKRMLQKNWIDKISSDVLNEWFDFFECKLLMVPNLIIYIKTSPKKAMERIEKRGRLEEKNIELESINELHELHEEWLAHNKRTTNIKVFEIDGDLDSGEIIEEYEKCIEGIFNYKKECMENETMIHMLECTL